MILEKKKVQALKISKRHNFRANANWPNPGMSLPKMPTPIRCELADNLPGLTFFLAFFGSYKKAVKAPKFIIYGLQRYCFSLNSPNI